LYIWVAAVEALRKKRKDRMKLSYHKKNWWFWTRLESNYSSCTNGLQQWKRSGTRKDRMKLNYHKRIDGFLSFQMLMYFFAGFILNLTSCMTKLRVRFCFFLIIDFEMCANDSRTLLQYAKVASHVKNWQKEI